MTEQWTVQERKIINMSWPVRASSIAGLGLCAVLVWQVQPAAQATPVPGETRTINGAKVDLWLPSGGTPPFTLVLFSHGVSGCRNQSAYILAALAEAGMIVAAPDHEDHRCDQKLGLDALPPEFYRPIGFDDAKYAGRRKQLHQLRTTLLADPKLGPKIDPTKLALIGHSLGGYTILGLAGALPGATPPGLRAVVALAPYLRAPLQRLAASASWLDLVARLRRRGRTGD